MLANRISFFSFLFVFFVFPYTQSSDFSFSSRNTFDAQEWISSYVERMNPEEIQIIGNFLYLIYANGIIDTKIQRYYTPLARLSQSARINLSEPTNSNIELIKLNKLTKQLATLIEMRVLYTKMLDNYLNHYNENKIEVVDTALKALQNHAANQLYIWAEDKKSDFAKSLQKSAKTISDCQNSMQFASGLHASLGNGILPIVVKEEDKPLAIMNAVLRTTPSFMHTADTTINVLNNLCDSAMETICFGTEIYKQYYQIVQELMMQESFDKKYATTLFTIYNTQLEENNSLLPDAEHVSEHMVEVMELMPQDYKEEYDN